MRARRELAYDHHVCGVEIGTRYQDVHHFSYSVRVAARTACAPRGLAPSLFTGTLKVAFATRNYQNDRVQLTLDPTCATRWGRQVNTGIRDCSRIQGWSAPGVVAANTPRGENRRKQHVPGTTPLRLLGGDNQRIILVFYTTTSRSIECGLQSTLNTSTYTTHMPPAYQPLPKIALADARAVPRPRPRPRPRRA